MKNMTVGIDWVEFSIYISMPSECGTYSEEMRIRGRKIEETDNKVVVEYFHPFTGEPIIITLPK